MSDRIVKRLEERIGQLEQELRQVKSELAEIKGPRRPWWEQIAGSHKDSPVFDEIVRLGKEIRDAERPRTRRNGAGGKAKPKPRKRLATEE